MTEPNPPVDVTTAWANEVVAGRIVSGKFVQGAAERHLRDLRDGAARGLHFDIEAANRALRFFPAVFQVTDGPKAGQPFEPLVWQRFVIGSLFGWKNTEGRWRYRSGWLETGKGQAKSPLMAGIALYVMGWCGIARAQCFAIAGDRNTAMVPFRDAVAMCRADVPGEAEGFSLEGRGTVVIRGVGDNANKIEHPETGSFFRTLAGGEHVSGPRPAIVIADEIHEFANDTAMKLWEEAIAKVAGNALLLMGTNTPATTQHVGTSYSEFYQKVATGELNDDSAFSFVARVDKADRETVFDNEDCWAKALPALGETFPIANIRERVATARTRVSTTSSVKRLYFGIATGAADFWIDEEVWAAALGDVDDAKVAALKGCPCWLSLDLSKKNDLTALSATWRDDDDRLWQKSWYWTTKVGLADREKRDHAPYTEWVGMGVLTAVDGATIDKAFVASQVAALVAEHDVQALVYDVAQFADFEAACGEIGLPAWKFEGPTKPPGEGLMMIAHAQGTRVMFEERQLCMPRSIERYEDRILNGTITIDRSPVTYMCAANAAIVEDGMKNRAFDKKRSRGRIDGAVTGAMGVGVADAPEFGATPFVYEGM